MSDSFDLPAAEAGDATDLRITVVIVVSERAEQLATVYQECRAAFEGTPYDPEFVLAAEPWARGLLEPFRERRAAGEPLRLLIAGQTVGETALMRAAVRTAEADIVVMLPAYHRVDAVVLPTLIENVRAGADVAVARRWPREDSVVNRIQTRTFHSLLRWLTGSDLTDVASGVRALRPELLDELPIYGDFGRFLPVLAARHGYRVVEVDAEQHPMDRSTRVYSPGVYLRRLLDLFGLAFLTRFTDKPLRFFGLFGAVFFAIGFVILAVITVQRFQGQGMAGRPLMLLGVILLVLGVQAIALGLVGEIIVHLNAARKRPYRLHEMGES